ncbi:MAG: hypothetical protein II813_10920 [Spirochaetales bacterium]|nr:hypothetical protein [Spirochaetales bacterium]MBQ3831409.1 hypothetical protein [Spirochaetales bacterium]MBQ4500954.1 hypothetical protein [Spirochaetales bacterium]
MIASGAKGLSILFPHGSFEACTVLSETAVHDLGLDRICESVSDKPKEQSLILGIMSRITADPDVVRFRLDVFDDIYRNPAFCERMLEILDKIEFLKDFGSFRRDNEESSGTWDLVHRLEEIRDYISYVEALQECLGNADLKSKGLNELKAHIAEIYDDNGFKELKEDIASLKTTTSSLKSVTVGINLNERFEAKEIGLISINSKEFTRSTLLDHFGNLISRKDNIKADVSWDGSTRFQPFSTSDQSAADKFMGLARTKAMMINPVLTMALVPDGDMGKDVTSHMDRITDHMLSQTVRKLKEVLGKYVGLSIMNITALIPEFIYYVRWAQYIKRHVGEGLSFCKASVLDKNREDGLRMRARGFYNLRLADFVHDGKNSIVANDLDFGSDGSLYILTGANRGGKTTITQATGLMFALAQGGVFVPASEFSFVPADCIFTHYPADEDKTLDYGRLGEECRRFREIFSRCTSDSLLLLNETFSTTSFEEGFFIARDAVKAILKKGTRCIYNTHMHKLASDIGEINAEGAKEGSSSKAASLVVLSDGGERSFKVKVAPPQGMSYARDIAQKYGVTYDMLMES